MPTFNIITADGPLAVEGKKFRVEVDGARFWFFVHPAHDRVNLLAVSELRSGRRVATVDPFTLACCKGDEVAAAKQTWAKLTATRDPENIRRVIETAPPL